MHIHFVLHTTPANRDPKEFQERLITIDSKFDMHRGDRIVVSTRELRERLIANQMYACGHIIVDPVEVANASYDNWIRIVNRNEQCTQHGRYPATTCIRNDPAHSNFSEAVV